MAVGGYLMKAISRSQPPQLNINKVCELDSMNCRGQSFMVALSIPKFQP